MMCRLAVGVWCCLVVVFVFVSDVCRFWVGCRVCAFGGFSVFVLLCVFVWVGFGYR